MAAGSPSAYRRHASRVRTSILPGRAGGRPPTPPQTRTSTINASGSSKRAVAGVQNDQPS